MSAVKVAVIGAGIAGLTAARNLVDHWQDVAASSGKEISNMEVVVFEGRGRIGGRIDTKTAAEVGLSDLDSAAAAKRGQFEMGAGWIHGSSAKHPLTKLKVALDLESVTTVEEKAEAWECSEGAVKPILKASDWKTYELSRLMEKAYYQAKASGQDMSLWDALEGLSSQGATRETPMVAWGLSGLVTAIGGKAETISCTVDGSGSDWNSFGGSKEEAILVNGYVQIPEALRDGTVLMDRNSNPRYMEVRKSESPKPLDVRLYHKTTKITHHSTGVLVEGEGWSYEADYTIVAVPLGVLKSKMITFDPPINGRQNDAIERLGFGNWIKVWVRFHEPFWAAKTKNHWLGLAQYPNPGLFCNYVNMQAVMDEPVLLCPVGGSDADLVDEMSEVQIWKEMRKNLVKMFGDDLVPQEYAAIYRSAWKKDEFARGTYTFVQVGTKDCDFAPLEEPILGNGTVEGMRADAKRRGLCGSLVERLSS